jgi:sugar lactone lactonase YvrE
VGGEPDDLAVDAHGRLVWGDIARGTVNRLDGTHVTVLARGLSVPEGIVPLPDGGLVVAEQGHDTIARLDARGRRTTLYHLAPVAGQEGVDGIGRDPRSGDLLIPDSPHGVVLRVSADGRRARVIARGLGRPVDAATDRRGDVLVPDEHLNALVVIAPSGRLSYRRNLSIPDDVAVDRHGNVWVTTLGDGGLWLIAPGTAPRRVLVGLANPQGLALDRCGDPIIVQSNIAHIDRLLLNSASAHCPL